MATTVAEISNSDDLDLKKLLNYWLSTNFVPQSLLDLILEQQVAEARERTQFTSIGDGFCAEVRTFPILHSREDIATCNS
jgi:hypothetical protein